MNGKLATANLQGRFKAYNKLIVNLDQSIFGKIVGVPGFWAAEPTDPYSRTDCWLQPSCSAQPLSTGPSSQRQIGPAQVSFL